MCVYVSEFAYVGILRGFGDVSAIGRVSMSRRGYHWVVCEVLRARDNVEPRRFADAQGVS